MEAPRRVKSKHVCPGLARREEGKAAAQEGCLFHDE